MSALVLHNTHKYVDSFVSWGVEIFLKMLSRWEKLSENVRDDKII